jgi:hypothetical protein
MSTELDEAILEIVAEHGESGVTMGRIVDTLHADGVDEQTAEMEVWSLMQQRMLTPKGFICRVVRQKGRGGRWREQRVYEFVLVAWSPDLDDQLDLELAHERGSGGRAKKSPK